MKEFSLTKDPNTTSYEVNPFYADNCIQTTMSYQPPQEQIQRELEAPLLERTSDIEIHSAIPLDPNESETTVVDGRCNVINKICMFGFFVGLVIQSCSLYALGIFMPHPNDTNEDAPKIRGDHSIPVLFALYFFCRYWVIAALLLPPVVCTMVQKFRKRHRKSKKCKKDLMRNNLESFFQCVRFQLGMFFGSLILLSLVNFYALAKTAPICMLLGYYAICVVVSLIVLCLLQVFVNQVCANISSVEIIVSYDNEDSDEDAAL